MACLRRRSPGWVCNPPLRGSRTTCAASPASMPTITRRRPSTRASCARMRDHMAARGPDGAGTWFRTTDRVGLGSRRLAIIDLSDDGSQPMVSADGHLRRHVQRRDLQLPGVAARAGRHAGPPSARNPTPRCCCISMPPRGRRWCATARHVRVRDVGRRKARLVARARSLRHQAALLRRRRLDLALRIAGQGAARRRRRLADPGPGRMGRVSICSAAFPSRSRRAPGDPALPAGTTLWVDAQRRPREPSRYYSVAASPSRRPSAKRRRRSAATSQRASARRCCDSVAPSSGGRCAGRRCFCRPGSIPARWLGLMRDAGHAISRPSRSPSRNSRQARRRGAAGRSRSRAQYGSRHTTRVVVGSGIPRGSAAHLRRRWISRDRRHQHLVRQQGGPRARPQGRDLRPRR